MLSNLHTHSTYCDGKSALEEIVLSALEKGFASIGFSGHGYTSFDLAYCMTKTQDYLSEIKCLQQKYQGKIQIYAGAEEDAFCPVCREDFDYIIGSLHYFRVDGRYHAIDCSYDGFKECAALFENDPLAMAHAYYQPFCDYIRSRRPDIVGHFDLITKYDQLDTSLFLENKDYLKVAQEYMQQAVASGCLFEVNTGAISRGYRTNPYPCEELLYVIKQNGNGIVLSSDSHAADTICFAFDETAKWLKDIGFTHSYVLYDSKFIKNPL